MAKSVRTRVDLLRKEGVLPLEEAKCEASSLLRLGKALKN